MFVKNKKMYLLPVQIFFKVLKKMAMFFSPYYFESFHRQAGSTRAWGGESGGEPGALALCATRLAHRSFHRPRPW